MKVTSLDLLATAAVRDASDGADFMRELTSRPGIKAHIVSGQDEARFSGVRRDRAACPRHRA